MKINLEVTDTFGGEANYSWVNRQTLEFDEQPSRQKIVRMAKKFAYLTGVKCEVEDFGDELVIRPIAKDAPCYICFVSFNYEVEE